MTTLPARYKSRSIRADIRKLVVILNGGRSSAVEENEQHQDRQGSHT